MASNAAQKRSNPFSRTGSQSPGPSPSSHSRAKSVVLSSPLAGHQTLPSHQRNQSFSNLGNLVSPANSSNYGSSNHNSLVRHRSNSKATLNSSNTFAPSFIKTEEVQRGSETVQGIEGENDFSGKRYVWLKDPQTAFVKGWVVEEMEGGQILVQCDDGSVRCSVGDVFSFC